MSEVHQQLSRIPLFAGEGTGKYIDRKAEAVNVKVANENPAEDFWAYAIGRFERCQALMASPGFGAHLAAVRDG